MIKKRRLLVVVLAGVVAFAGCSSSDKTSAPSDLAMAGGVLPLAITQESYSQTVVVTGGKLNYEFELNHDLLPPGIIAEWVDNDLVFHGNATTVGTYTIPVTVIDANKDTADAVFVINVADTIGIEGTWSMVITVTNATQDCAGEEGVSPPVLVTISQSGSGVSVAGFLGDPSNVLVGTIGGANSDILTVSGSYGEDGGTTTATHVWQLDSETTMTGTESWSWTNGVNSCPGSSSTVVCTKVEP